MEGHGVTSKWLLSSMSEQERQYLNARFTALEKASLALSPEKHFSTQAAGAWPDTIRKIPLTNLFDSLSTPLPKVMLQVKHKDSNRWHYHNTPHFLNVGSARGCQFENKGELLASLALIDRGLAGPLTPVQEAVLLSFLIHLVLDLHQPLHTISAVDEHCKHDYGGNRYCVGVRKNKRCSLNLHRLWDGGFGLFDSPAFEREFILSSSQAVPSLLSVDRLLAFSPKRWVEEGGLLAGEVYSVNPEPSLSEPYLSRSREVSRERLVLGLRRIRFYLQRHIDKLGGQL